MGGTSSSPQEPIGYFQLDFFNLTSYMGVRFFNKTNIMKKLRDRVDM
jgi:hypothetical protein